MLDAHMDEVGLMIVAKEGDGTYRFEKVGGIDPQYLAGKQVWVGKKRIEGVIGAKPIHLTTQEERTKRIDIESLRIDVGKNTEIHLGDRAVFATLFRLSGASIMAKAIDDRIGVATLIELIKHAPDEINLCAVFSVQEEIGTRGAGVAANYFNPDLAVVVDATPAYDLPSQNQTENSSYNTRLGHGPAIYTMDKSTLHSTRLIRFMIACAEEKKISYQMRQPGGGGTNAGVIQRSMEGIPAVSVSVPHRYPHSPISIARLSDWQETLNLLQVALKRVTPDLIR